MMKYSSAFKEEAIKLSDEIGVTQAAAQLGVPHSTLAGWRQQRRVRKQNEASLLHMETEERIRQLECENRVLRESNKIFMDTVNYLVKDRNK